MEKFLYLAAAGFVTGVIHTFITGNIWLLFAFWVGPAYLYAILLALISILEKD